MNGGSDPLTQGGIYLAHLNPNKGAEIGKIRPVCLLTNQRILNRSTPLVFICPLSSQSFGINSILHLPIAKRDSINKNSFALIEQCRSIDIKRIKLPRLGQLNFNEIRTIKKHIYILIDIEPRIP